MANELRHSDVGTALSKSEWEAVGGHIFNSQAAGDIMYASTTSQLTRLGIGTANQVLATNSGATAPEWVTSVASATLAATVTVVDSTDTSSYIAMFDSATGSLAAKTDAGITYNAGTGMLTATGFTGPLTGNASGLSATLAVASGGTGATSLADKAVLISQDTGTDTVGAVALTTSGQIIIGGSSGPAAATLTEGSNITITNGDGSISIAADAAGTPTAITVADTTDTTAYVALFDSATGDLGPKTDAGITYNAGTGMLTATGFTGPLTGTLQTAAQTNITSVGTITTGTWEGTTVAVDQGGTGATSLSNLITLATHTTGDYVQNITAGTGLTSTGATSGENIAHSLSVDASQTQITAVGTIATGVWQGTAVASAYLDADTAHLTTTQTFTGAKTFDEDITMAADKSLNLPQGANITFTDAVTQDSIDDDDHQGIIMTFTAGSTVTQYSPVYLGTDDEVHECDADAIATMPAIGVSVNTSDVADGNPIEVMLLGLIRNEDFTDFGTNGAPVFVSTTVGVMSNTAPSDTDDVVQIVGHSIGEKLLFVQPSLSYVVVA